MYDNKNRGKTKNGKILRWRLELMQYNYKISYRAGKHNTAPGSSFFRVYCANLSTSTLYDIQAALRDPAVTRMYHYVKVKNRPYSIEEVCRMIPFCKICAEVKPQFYQPPEMHLIKATQPMERLSIDFKGPLPSAGRNKRAIYAHCNWREFIYFPFGFPCRNMESETIVSC